MPARYFLLQTATIAFIVAGCASPHHYKAYLFKGESGDVSDRTFSRIVDGAIYHEYDEARDENDVIEVSVNNVYLGQLHRDFLDKEGKPVIDNDAQVYSGFETWIVAEAVSIDNENPLMPAESRHVGFTSVKIDQEAFAPIPISRKEAALFKLPRARDYRITIRVYEVDGYRLKRALYGAKDTDLAQWAYTTATGALETLDNALTKSLTDIARRKSEEDNLIEELLLSIGSDLEFQGTFYLLQNRDGNQDSYIKRGTKSKTYALVDILRSHFDHDGNYLMNENHNAAPELPPSSPDQYMSGLRAIRNQGHTVTLDPLINYYNVASDAGTQFQSFVTFSINKGN